MSEWQPIETAPKGVNVLGWTGERYVIGRRYDSPQQFGWPGALIDGRSGKFWSCTHWMPLPAPPQEAAR